MNDEFRMEQGFERQASGESLTRYTAKTLLQLLNNIPL